MKKVMTDMRRKADCSFLELVWPPGRSLQGKPAPGKRAVREVIHMEEHAPACQAKRLPFPLQEQANCSQSILKIRS